MGRARAGQSVGLAQLRVADRLAAAEAQLRRAAAISTAARTTTRSPRRRPMREPALGEQYRGPRASRTHALRFGMWVFLGSEMLLFAGLFALYAAYRAMYGERLRRRHPAQHARRTARSTRTSSSPRASPSRCRSGRCGAARRALARRACCCATMLPRPRPSSSSSCSSTPQHLPRARCPGRYYHFAELPTFGANRFFTLY